MPDYRSQPMESREGKGLARRAWDSYARGANKVGRPLLEPFLEPIAERVSVAIVDDLVGFWLLWHLEGGFDGLERLGMHRATVFRKINRFRRFFGEHPDEFRFPGVTINLDKYIDSGKTVARGGKK